MIHEYERHAKYYETDQMGIIHHSNYIRWMEEARIDMMDSMGCGYRRMEEEGVVIPVLDVRCQYKSMVHFDDTVKICVRLKEYNGVRMALGYVITDKETGELRAVGESRHCFLDRNSRPVSLKRSYPEWNQAFSSAVETGRTDK